MTAKAEREARLAARLRENLKRRKMAARAGPPTADPTESVEGTLSSPKGGNPVDPPA